MKRMIVYIAILASLFVVPVEQMDVSQLIPVKVVSLYKENGYCVVQTDTENVGIGDTVQQALENLKTTASGIIYLDTAQYLLLTDDAKDMVQSLRQKLKPSVKLCQMQMPIDMETVSEFLDSHGDIPRLRQWEMDAQLPCLSMVEDSYIFLKKVENSA